MITPFIFWHTIMILQRCNRHDMRRTSIDFGVNRSKVKVKFGLLPFLLPFLLDNSISFWHTMVILHTCIERDPRRTSVDFEVKCQGHILTLNFVPFPHGDLISF